MLLEKLIEKQQTLKLSDREMGRRLGVSRTMWAKTRREIKPVGISIITGTLREFPELTTDVLLFLASKGTISTIGKTSKIDAKDQRHGSHSKSAGGAKNTIETGPLRRP